MPVLSPSSQLSEGNAGRVASIMSIRMARVHEWGDRYLFLQKLSLRCNLSLIAATLTSRLLLRRMRDRKCEPAGELEGRSQARELAAIAVFSLRVVIRVGEVSTQQRPMHHFDLLGEVVGCTTLERILHATKLVMPHEVKSLFVVMAPFRVCSTRVYDDKLKIVVEPAGRPQTLERRGEHLLKTVHTSSQKEHRHVRRS